MWPPSQSHQLDLSLLDETSCIDSRVISLMQHLPLLPSQGKSVALCMRPVDYTEPGKLACSRDIDKLRYWAPPDESRLDMSNAKPTVLELLSGEEGRDSSLVLDIADSIQHFPI